MFRYIIPVKLTSPVILTLSPTCNFLEILAPPKIVREPPLPIPVESLVPVNITLLARKGIRLFNDTAVLLGSEDAYPNINSSACSE